MSSRKERKRVRGELACAECRRSKARCDKQVPCSTCIRRGCDILCPNGTMPPGESSRSVSVAEAYLRQIIVKMEERMHSLEDALAIIHGPTSYKPHPLLDENWNWPREESEWTSEVDRDPMMSSKFGKYGLADSLGSLYLDGGPISSDPTLSEVSGNSESLLLQAKAFVAESSSPINYAEEVDCSYLPSEIIILYQTFPFTSPGVPKELVQGLIESYLPPLSRATALLETFLQSMSWMFRIVSREYVLGDLIPSVYGYASGQNPTQPRSYGPHDLALLFIVLAIGALVDPALPPYNVEGQHYHILSRAAMCLQEILVQSSVVTIKTLNLMSIYNGMCGIESKLENSFSLMDLAAQVAVQIGFHKDPSVWGITGKEAYERRAYFWDVLTGTLFQSLVAGRPPVFVPSFIDCHTPTKEEEDVYQSCGVPIGFGAWSFTFVAECLLPVVEVTQGARSSSYDTVLALDCKIRKFSMPQASNSNQMSMQMQSFVRNHLRELTLLFLHRGFFAQALASFPCDPLKSPFGHSFLAAYRSATEFLNVTWMQFVHQPTLCARVWRIWTVTFSAAIIIGTVAIQRLSVKLEPEPFEQLDLACTLFRKAADTSIRAQKALPILLRLRQEAINVRLKAPLYGSVQPDNTPEGDRHREACNNRGTPVDWSGLPAHHHQVPSMVPSDDPCNTYMQVLPVPVVRPPVGKIGESDEELCVGTDSVPLEQHDLYHETSSLTGFGSHRLPSAPYINRPPE